MFQITKTLIDLYWKFGCVLKCMMVVFYGGSIFLSLNNDI